MVLYSFGDQGNWIIAAGVFHAVNADVAPALIENLAQEHQVLNIHLQKKITIVAHGGIGGIGVNNDLVTGNDLANILLEMGLPKNYGGIIELYACHSAEWDTTQEVVTESVVDTLGDIFNRATVVGSHGSLIIDPYGRKHYVNPNADDVAVDIQDFFTDGLIEDLDKNIDPNGDIYQQGENICHITTSFYNKFLNALYEMQLMSSANEGKIIRQN